MFVRKLVRLQLATLVRGLRGVPTNNHAKATLPVGIVRPCRGFLTSLKEKLTDKMQARQEDKEEKAFKDHVASLIACPRFTLEEFHKQIQGMAETSGVTGWKAKLPGVSQMAGVQQLKSFLKILEAMEPSLREDPQSINGRTKRVVSEKSGESVQDINTMLKNFEQVKAVRGWLIKRDERKLPLPESQPEMTEMMYEDPTGYSMKAMKKYMKPKGQPR